MPRDHHERPPDPDSIRGVVEEIKNAAHGYLGARIALVRLEGKEAGREVARRGLAVLAGFFLLLVAYGLFLVGLIGLAENYREGSWPVAALIIGVCHVLIGLPILLAARRPSRQQYFEESLNQWREDEQWMSRVAKDPAKKTSEK